MAKKKRLNFDNTANNGITFSSGNVFEDLAVKNPEEALVKARIAQYLSSLISELNLSQSQIAKMIGIDQPKISKILKGQLREFSIQRLLTFVALLGEQVEVVIRTRRKVKRNKHFRINLFTHVARKQAA